MTEPLIFEISSPGRTAFTLPELDVPQTAATRMVSCRDDLPCPN